jgi:hypothetical protein
MPETHEPSPDETTKCGALVEPRVCNRWQPVANPCARNRQNQAKTVAVRCDQLPRW